MEDFIIGLLIFWLTIFWKIGLVNAVRNFKMVFVRADKPILSFNNYLFVKTNSGGVVRVKIYT